MSKGNTFENDLLKLIFNATAISNLADNAASGPLTNLYVALHTADPGEGGDQTSNEASYTSYARVAVARTSGGWTVSGNQVTNAGLIQFPQCTGGSNNITHWSIGVASSGASKILYKGHVGSIPLPFTAKTDDSIEIPGHTLAVDDRVAFYAEPGQGLPTGITEGQVYWVKTVSGNTITISTTQGGATVDITAAGSGMGSEVTVLAVTNLVQPQFSAGQLKVIET
jgi:hypothetical protein